jgi:hypothetical protein
MGRTAKDIFIQGITIEELRNFVQNWFVQNEIVTIENNPQYIKGKMGVGIWQAIRYFQVSFMQAQNGVVAHTEGWISQAPFGGEKDLSANAIAAALPRREGWHVMERLWVALQNISSIPQPSVPQSARAIPSQQPSYPPPPPRYQQPQSPQQTPPPPPPQYQQPSYQPPPPTKAKGGHQEAQTSSKTPKFCSSCGASLGERAVNIKFCPNCGERIA